MTRVFAALFLSLASLAQSAAPDWQSSLTREAPGHFPEMRPLRAVYNFGWSGLTAAAAEVRTDKPSDNRFKLEASGHTIGLARALWKYDVEFDALSDARTFHPLETKQVETMRSKKITTRLAFNSAGVNRKRSEGNNTPDKGKTFLFPNVFDLYSTMLYLRSQPLKDHAVYRVVVYPTTSPYLVTLTVLGREKISLHPGSYNAIKMDVKLSKVGKDLDLQPHRKFRKATAWVSDDDDRIILRAEAQIFLGTIFAELQSVKFDGPALPAKP